MSTNTNTPRPDWLDLKQIEREFPVSKRSLWVWISSGKLPAYRPFRKVLVKRSDLEKLLEATRVGADLEKLIDETLGELGK